MIWRINRAWFVVLVSLRENLVNGKLLLHERENFFWDSILPSGPNWPWTQDPAASASQVLRSQAFMTRQMISLMALTSNTCPHSGRICSLNSSSSKCFYYFYLVKESLYSSISLNNLPFLLIINCDSFLPKLNKERLTEEQILIHFFR